MRFTTSSTALFVLLGASSALAAPKISREDSQLVARDGVLSTVADGFHNVTGAIADGITNYTSAVGNATRDAVHGDDNASSALEVPNSVYFVLAGSMLTGLTLL